MVNPSPELVAPEALLGGPHAERARAAHGRAGLGATSGLGPVEPDDDRSGATVEEKVAHCEAEGALLPHSAEGTLEVTEAGDDDRSVDGSPGRPADEGRDRGGDTGDGADPAGTLFDVHARIGQLDRHFVPPSLAVGSKNLETGRPR